MASPRLGCHRHFSYICSQRHQGMDAEKKLNFLLEDKNLDDDLKAIAAKVRDGKRIDQAEGVLLYERGELGYLVECCFMSAANWGIWVCWQTPYGSGAMAISPILIAISTSSPPTSVFMIVNSAPIRGSSKSGRTGGKPRWKRCWML